MKKTMKTLGKRSASFVLSILTMASGMAIVSAAPINANAAEVTVEETGAANVTVIAKDGTIRSNYQKYAELANTSIKAIGIGGVNAAKTQRSGNKLGSYTVNDTAYNSFAETVTIPELTTIYFETAIDSSSRSKYYVRAFDVNGTTVKVDSSDSGNGTYTGHYTIPTGTNCTSYEITPIYYYQNDYVKTLTGGGDGSCITFFAENFDSKIQAKWGENSSNGTHAVLACYAWYSDGTGTDNDTLSASAVNKSTLGGFPGQPMVYENGRYEMQVIPYTDVDRSNKIMGVTLNNYAWDDVHSAVLGATTDAQRQAINCQTYDYDDFSQLHDLISQNGDYRSDEIYFRFKYKDQENAVTTATGDYYANRDAGNKITSTNAVPTSLKNGFEVYKNRYGEAIDLNNNILSQQFSSADAVKNSGTYYTIVSDGNKDIYYGHFGVRWNVYKNEGNTVTYVGEIPSSALFYKTNDLQTHITRINNTKTALEKNNALDQLDRAVNNYVKSYADDFLMDTTQGDWDNDELGEYARGKYFLTYLEIREHADQIPAIITYESAIYANDQDSGNHPDDPALRSDGRWFYSEDLGQNATITAELAVMYKANGSSTYVEDPLTVVSGVRQTRTVAASPSLRVGNDYELLNLETGLYETKPAPTDTENQFVMSTQEESNGYYFIGWYREIDGVLSFLSSDAEASFPRLYDKHFKFVAKYSANKNDVPDKIDDIIDSDQPVDSDKPVESDTDTNKDPINVTWDSSDPLIVEFKYYDRNDDEDASGLPETINETETTVTVKVTSTNSGLTGAVTDAFDTAPSAGVKPISGITSAVDEYYFWTTQEEAVGSFADMTNLHCENSNATYRDTYASDDLANHADCYGYLFDSTVNGFKLENWVTYTTSTGKVSESYALEHPWEIKKVTVWGFNTPKDYTVTFAAPYEDYEGTAKAVAALPGQDAYFFQDAVLTPFVGKYNERIGTDYAGFAINSISDYYQKVFSTTNANKNNESIKSGKLPGNNDSEQRVAKDIVTVGDTSYYFTGWFVMNSSTNTYEKVSTDIIYANRVYGDLDLVAGYTTEKPDYVNPKRGITVTKGNTEKFREDVVNSNGSTEPVDYVRYQTIVNPYGYNDSDERLTQMAIIYMFVGYRDDDNVIVHPGAELNNFDPEDFRDIIKTAMNDSSNFGERVFYNAELTTPDANGAYYDKKFPSAVYVYLTNANDGETDVYSGTVDSTEIRLTNKNRAQFSLVLQESETQPGGSYSDIIAFAAVIDQEAESDDCIVISDNYVRYSTLAGLTD